MFEECSRSTFFVSSKNQARHGHVGGGIPNWDSELMMLCHAGLKFHEISAGFNVSTRSDVSERHRSSCCLLPGLHDRSAQHRS